MQIGHNLEFAFFGSCSSTAERIKTLNLNLSTSAVNPPKLLPELNNGTLLIPKHCPTDPQPENIFFALAHTSACPCRPVFVSYWPHSKQTQIGPSCRQIQQPSSPEQTKSTVLITVFT